MGAVAFEVVPDEELAAIDAALRDAEAAALLASLARPPGALADAAAVRGDRRLPLAPVEPPWSANAFEQDCRRRASSTPPAPPPRGSPNSPTDAAAAPFCFSSPASPAMPSSRRRRPPLGARRSLTWALGDPAAAATAACGAHLGGNGRLDDQARPTLMTLTDALIATGLDEVATAATAVAGAVPVVGSGAHNGLPKMLLWQQRPKHSPPEAPALIATGLDEVATAATAVAGAVPVVGSGAHSGLQKMLPWQQRLKHSPQEAPPSPPSEVEAPVAAPWHPRVLALVGPQDAMSDVHLIVREITAQERRAECSLVAEEPNVEQVLAVAAPRPSVSQTAAEASSQRPARASNSDESHSRAAVMAVADVEDISGRCRSSPLELYRRRRGLAVTDFTASEWCERQVEFSFVQGAPAPTLAMQMGSSRHAEMEAEVKVAVEVKVVTVEDKWAVRLLDTISGLRQLSMEGLTRELCVLGVIEGTWMVGIIDELRMVDGQQLQHNHSEASAAHTDIKRPLLVETKTRKQPTPPRAAQMRNNRLQLMCYKLLLDRLITGQFPVASFFQSFSLKWEQPLSFEVVEYALGMIQDRHVLVLQDVVAVFLEECKRVPLSHDSLLLRYEWQGDKSLLGEHHFEHDPEWLQDLLAWHMQYWRGGRPPSFVSFGDEWKCRHCHFAGICPAASSE
eukprot:SM000272S10275  [mRNA]  locus=s272:142827:146167:- [translate_table: standard]